MAKNKKVVAEVQEPVEQTEVQTNGNYKFVRTEAGKRARGEVERAVDMAKAAGKEKVSEIREWIKEHFGEEVNQAHISALLNSEGKGAKRAEWLKVIQEEVPADAVEGLLRWASHWNSTAEKVGGFDNFLELLKDRQAVEEAEKAVGGLEAGQAGALAKLLETMGSFDKALAYLTAKAGK